MADIWSEEKRSWVMSRIKGKDTKPELAVRSLLHAHGYRFTVSGPRNQTLPGRPDIVLPKWATVIFVNGCFWHGHEGCKDFSIPKTRTEFWLTKIRKNQQRDQSNNGKLESLGWNVITIWACELSTKDRLYSLERRLPYLIERKPFEYHLEDETDQLGRVAEDFD
ncbi:T/G mismatch-specific endonuclease [Rubritalea squalenifaciens DSM 18772]|uniref:T/G mismatch-specific endonuclease n=1 Tax=Rubritalea squalenifaciens DSM 18772 TaxID=1123071 RepID=A0A1M6D197_9BACT|nr:very short patch repair endonuclease [Rubritalea squalenifaciens]SHI67062.1 T/G mismatch-specific endonuclease [Rubritalea squalenifaciens DSM 18772]